MRGMASEPMKRDLLKRLDPVPSAALVATGLVGGFASARYSGSRALGGVVLAACGTAAGRRWLADRGAGATAALSALYLGAFGVSHPLAKKLGAWPSVLAVTAVATAAAAAADSER